MALHLGGQHLAEILTRVVLESGRPEKIQVDNGPEFAHKRLDRWAYLNQVELDFSRPGKPADNALIEAFNGRFKEEGLNQSCFFPLEDAREKVEAWRLEYNRTRPQEALGNLASGEFAETLSLVS